MSRRNSKASLKAKSSQVSGEISFHFESGETYRPFTSVERITSIDAKKHSKDDPRLSNVSKEVPREHMLVFSINEAAPDSSVPQQVPSSSSSSEGAIKIEECEPTPSLLASTERKSFNAQSAHELSIIPEQGWLPQRVGKGMEYSVSQSQNSIPRYQHDFINDIIPGSLAISTDFTQFHAAPVQHQNLFLPSAINTPLNGYTYSFPLDSPNSPTTSYSSSPAESIISYDTYDDALCKAQSTFIHQDSSMTDAIYSMDLYQNSQYPDLNSSGSVYYHDLTGSSFDQWPVDQKAHYPGSEQLSFDRPTFIDSTLSFPNGLC